MISARGRGKRRGVVGGPEKEVGGGGLLHTGMGLLLERARWHLVGVGPHFSEPWPQKG